MHKIPHFIILLLLIVSCSANQDVQVPPTSLFSASGELAGEVLELNDGSLTNPQQLMVVDSLLFIHDQFQTGNGDTYLYTVVNRKNGELYRHFGREGRGPDEFIFPSFMSRNQDQGSFYIYDNNRSAIYPISIDRVLSSGEGFTTNVLSEIPPYFKVMKTESLLVGTGPFLNGRYSVSNLSGTTLFEGGTYPFEDTFSYEYPVFGMAFQSKLGLHPRKNRFVSATSSSANLEIVAFTIDSLNILSRHHTYPPVFESQSTGEDFLSVTLEPRNRWGYSSIDVTGTHIYALYSGKPMEEERFHYGVHLLVFDWEGNPVIRYELNREIHNLSVTSDGSTLYGLSETLDGLAEILIFSLNPE